MEIEQWSVDRLVPYSRNLRKNNDAVDVMVRAIQEYGFRVPVLVRGTGEIIDGHLRLKAAKKAGLETVPIIKIDDMTDLEVKAFRISINKLSELADWDEELLRAEIMELKLSDYDVDAIGFNEEELAALLHIENDGNKKPDDIPPLPVNPVSIEGDVWLLDGHRLMCGDSTVAVNLLTLMVGAMADLIVTDPPYNVNYEGQGAGGAKIKNDNMANHEFYEFLKKAFTAMVSVLNDGGGVYVAHAEAGKVGYTFRRAFMDVGLKLASCLIWRKNHFVLSRQDYHWQHEPILYGWKEGAGHSWYGGRKKTTIRDFDGLEAVQKVSDNEIQINVGDEILVITGENIHINSLLTTVITNDRPVVSKLHPTMKPVSLIEKFLKNSSRKGQVVLDPFGGGGSTLIACEKKGRIARIMELDPRFADVIVCRWQDYTDKRALLENGGNTFEEVKVKRLS